MSGQPTPPAGTEPVGRAFGLDRGHAIDRHYIEGFLRRNRGDIRGRVLEVGDDRYARMFGGDAALRCDVYDLPRNPRANVHGDLGGESGLPAAAFDCMIVCQTLLFVYDLRRAFANVRAALRPGGVLLLTVPGISQIVRENMDDEGDYWRFTTRSIARLAQEQFAPDRIDVQSSGNVLAAVAFLQGLAREDLPPDALEPCDPDFQLVVTLRAVG